MVVILKRRYCWLVYRYEIVLDIQHIWAESIWKKKEFVSWITNTENSCFESAASHLLEMYRKTAYKIVQGEYLNIFEGLKWIPSLHVRNVTSNL